MVTLPVMNERLLLILRLNILVIFDGVIEWMGR